MQGNTLTTLTPLSMLMLLMCSSEWQSLQSRQLLGKSLHIVTDGGPKCFHHHFVVHKSPQHRQQTSLLCAPLVTSQKHGAGVSAAANLLYNTASNYGVTTIVQQHVHLVQYEQ